MFNRRHVRAANHHSRPAAPHSARVTRQTGATQPGLSRRGRRLFSTDDPLKAPRDADQTDVLIVGGGPAGLSAAIRLKQLAKEHNKDLRVCLLEKGAQIGSHILSGAVLEPRGLNELFPDWKEKGAPVRTKVESDSLQVLLNDNIAIPAPVVTHMHNEGNYIISLSQLTRWMAEQAEGLGVEIYAGYPGSEVLYHEDGSVKGVATGDVGIGKDGKPTDQFARGLELHASVTLFAEGVRGSLSKQLIKKFKLNANSDPQTYGLGIKEVWEVPKEKFKKGTVVHTMGWPMDLQTWGGGFIYHWEDNQVLLGFVTALDYKNPYLSPYQEMQRWKHHPTVKTHIEGGKPVAYGARTINEGGIQSLPELVFPGGALIGCSAGFLNVPKIKGNHLAMKTGMVAAEAAFHALAGTAGAENKPRGVLLKAYTENIKQSWAWKELHGVRNIRPSFAKFGSLGGILYSGLDWLFLKGREPWTLHHTVPDNAATLPASEVTPITYPKPDGKLSFDLLTNLSRSGTNHNENQPPHLKVRNPDTPVGVNLAKYAGPESRYCPAGVYEFVDGASGGKKLQINAQNCLHCKTCDIKDPTQNIDYTTPEGSGGPNYTIM